PWMIYAPARRQFLEFRRRNIFTGPCPANVSCFGRDSRSQVRRRSLPLQRPPLRVMNGELILSNLDAGRKREEMIAMLRQQLWPVRHRVGPFQNISSADVFEQ